MGGLRKEIRQDLGARREPCVCLTPSKWHHCRPALTDLHRENAQSVLDEYYESVGGRDKIMEEARKALKTKKRGPPTSNTPTSTSHKRSRTNGDHPARTTPPATAAWKPPAGSWEDEITDLDACEDEETGKLMVYLTWKDGHKTQHETSVIYKRCPQKVRRPLHRHSL